MWEAIWKAAERGVRVRLLLDDANTGGLDPTLAALDAHPNIEIRLFNPFANRGFRAGDFAFDFSRVNRRMHNKSFTADNQVSIVGGRNIGDEYFGANMEVGFQDLDVMAVGPVVSEVSKQFDLFWNSASAYPAASLMRARGARRRSNACARDGTQVHQNPEAHRYVEAVRQTPLLRQMADRSAQLRMDDGARHPRRPGQGARADRSHGPADAPLLQKHFGKPKNEMDLVSPYFVPGKGGTKSLTTLAQNGIKVRMLTNSLSATDVSPVHAGYAKYRKELLQSGVTLYELKPGVGVPPPDKDDDEVRRPSGAAAAAAVRRQPAREDLRRGSRPDLRRLVQPRPPLCAPQHRDGRDHRQPECSRAMLARQFDTVIPKEAYQVRLQAGWRRMEWIDTHAARRDDLHTEPGSGALKRGWIDFLEILPIEWLLWIC